jgi:hypothetical protein
MFGADSVRAGPEKSSPVSSSRFVEQVAEQRYPFGLLVERGSLLVIHPQEPCLLS